MAKRKISVEQIVRDIRSGQPDSAIMEKYDLSAEDLHKILIKLVERGFIKPADLERDQPDTVQTVLVSGDLEVVTDPLAASIARTSVQTRQQKTGPQPAIIGKPKEDKPPSRIVPPAEKPGPPGTERTVEVEPASVDKQPRVTKAPPASVSPAQAEAARTDAKKSAEKPVISAADVIADLRAGMDDAALMRKYKLTAKGCQSLCRKLVKAKVISQEEIDGRSSVLRSTVNIAGVMDELDDSTPQEEAEAPARKSPPSAALRREERKERPSTVKKAPAPRPQTEPKEGERAAVPAKPAPLAAREDKKAAPAEEQVPEEVTEAGDGRFIVETFWYDNNIVTVLLLFTLFPVGFYALYRNRELSQNGKSLLLGAWTLVVVSVVYVVFWWKPGESPEAADIMRNLNAQKKYCRFQVEGLFSRTLTIDWTTRTGEQDKKEILAALELSKGRLTHDGVRYVKYPNPDGSYTIKNLETGEEKTTTEKALPWFQRAP